MSHRPRTAPRRRRRVMASVAAAGLLIVAAVATVTAPTDDEIQTPLKVTGAIGEPVVSRQTEMIVHGVAVAEELDFDQADAPPSTTTGAWVVVDVTTVCRLASCSFVRSELRVDGRAFAAATLAPLPSFIAQAPAPGLRYRSSALFEVPRDAVGAGTAEFVLQINETTALDSVAVVRFDLPATVSPSAEVRSSELEGDTT